MYTINEFKEKIRKKGMRVTPQKVSIFQILASTKKHPHAEAIFNEVKKFFPETSLATVYSTLKSFEKLGLIQEIGTFADSRRFDANIFPHHHLICMKCYKIEDLEVYPQRKDIKKLEKFVSQKYGYKLIKSALNFYGYCPQCKKKF